MKRIKIVSDLFYLDVRSLRRSFYRSDHTGAAKSDKAPSFTLNLLSGGDLKSSDLKGKITVLKFVASY